MSSTPITLLDVQLSTIYNDYSHLGFSPSNLIDNSFTTSAATAVSSSGPSANWLCREEGHLLCKAAYLHARPRE